MDLHAWAAPRRAAVDAVLLARFGDAWPPRFLAACRYPLQTGGKRIRPLLTRAAGEAVAGADAPIDALLAAGAAVELVHTYSLVHDDLPAMDDDDERRGQPTVHRAYDEATAVLVGDALLTEAFAVLAAAPASDAARVAMVAELARAAGHIGMIGGQAADIAWTGGDVDALVTVHRGKTGALIRAATLLGGIAAGASAVQLAQLTTYGEAVGLAFQLADDVLDEDEDAGDDGPPSYVRLLGVDETLRRAHELAVRAEAAARTLPSPDALVALARFTVARDH
ncbi:MAG: polyprenyl synthetase family protein [Alphaproteobacteria bacterium]|nr:polyprenyl synthetase family protein [Alphaproteobacteria bacterium]